MLVQNRTRGGLALFLACPLQQPHFHFPSRQEKECTSTHAQHFYAGVWERETDSRYHDLSYQIPNHF